MILEIVPLHEKRHTHDFVKAKCSLMESSTVVPFFILKCPPPPFLVLWRAVLGGQSGCDFLQGTGDSRRSVVPDWFNKGHFFSVPDLWNPSICTVRPSYLQVPVLRFNQLMAGGVGLHLYWTDICFVFVCCPGV